MPCGAVLDSDGDGVLDDKDRCPDTPKGVAVDAVGCPLDSDGDGVVDMHDKCPNTPRGVKVDTSGCPLDSDGDGVYDYMDKCPGTPAGAAVDGKGCPLDSDGDGVYDYMDKCPGTPKGAKVDSDGCMFEIVLNNVLFETNSAELKPESKLVLEKLADVLKGRPDVTGVKVIGHTDSMGSAAYNMGLSERRAASVARYLTGTGVSGSLLTSKGMGESDPVASNDNAEGRMMNRRVVFEIAR
ncbi:hypothetical protein BOW53_15460 [Solemya pervernicosa gill symbiont]|uniref:OmpA-like domain-containing protein n=1 Tax=Solemya pervernicosa gill symbiont TaxID=642797 RepID=A0A1T2L039_9GAMM|nr:OmpA family protein [Solemya pervernicosa gill symbiont]OOZ38477.1 hypothetical protein BOW53_15460 [Solemya pervernicosa gill symbiont]